MEKIKLLALIMIVILNTSFISIPDFTKLSGTCDVANFYSAFEPDSDVKVLTTLGDLEDAELILSPAKIDAGTYNVKLTRKGSNLYKLEGTDYYIETKYCYEYSMYDEAILKVVSNYGYSKGTVYFD